MDVYCVLHFYYARETGRLQSQVQTDPGRDSHGGGMVVTLGSGGPGRTCSLDPAERCRCHLIVLTPCIYVFCAFLHVCKKVIVFDYRLFAVHVSNLV